MTHDPSRSHHARSVGAPRSGSARRRAPRRRSARARARASRQGCSGRGGTPRGAGAAPNLPLPRAGASPRVCGRLVRGATCGPRVGPLLAGDPHARRPMPLSRYAPCGGPAPGKHIVGSISGVVKANKNAYTLLSVALMQAYTRKADINAVPFSGDLNMN